MTPKQLAELLEYIKTNNCWGIDMYEINYERNRRAIKYVDASFDSRDGLVWRLEFRSVTGVGEMTFRVENENDLKKVYEWLDEPFM
jgi:hypothetical protein